jgi:hypothetical protein
MSLIKSPVRDHGLCLDLQKLREDYNSVFWSSIWYFSAIGLPYDLFLPYSYSRYDRINISEIRNNDVSFKNLEVNKSINCEIRNRIEDSQYSQLSYKTNGYYIKDETILEKKESRTKSMDNLKLDNFNL